MGTPRHFRVGTVGGCASTKEGDNGGCWNVTTACPYAGDIGNVRLKCMRKGSRDLQLPYVQLSAV